VKLSRLADSWWLWLIGGVLYGLLMRLLFGWLGLLNPGFTAAMSLGFLVGTPLVVGALTVYGGRREPQSVVAMLFRPWATVGLMLAGCGLALIEGLICLVLMAPLFLVCGSLGGLIMGAVLRLRTPGRAELGAVLCLPLLITAGESSLPLPETQLEIRQAVDVDAPPQTVWRQILTARDIHAEELPLSLTHLIGVPRPLEGVNLLTPEGEVRYSKWERGVNFRANVTERTEYRRITWRYAFDAHSFPEGSMDEHVAIGGRYFDLHDTTFNLQELPGGRTRLEIVAHYRVTSSLNAYVVPASRLLGHDFVHTILGLYKYRSERAALQQ
jgi:hypothetical protein